MVVKVTLSRRRTEFGWRTASTVEHWLYSLGIVSGAQFSYTADGDAIAIYVDLRPRPYVLGMQRKYWRHLLRPHRYVEVWGLCGHCYPWPCCGAVGYSHIPDCEDADASR